MAKLGSTEIDGVLKLLAALVIKGGVIDYDPDTDTFTI